MTNKVHIQLLTDAEVESLYARPTFNTVERQGYFYLEGNERELVEKWGTLKSKVFFILQLGYFRAMQKFYHFSLDDVTEDVEHILSQHFSPPDRMLQGTLSAAICRQQRQCILKYYGYTPWHPSMKPKVLAQLQQLITLHPKGHDTLHELLAYFEKEQITIPSYRTFQDLFTQALRLERERLSGIMDTISPDLQVQLQDIIANKEGVSYLNILRADQKNFNYTAIKTEAQKAQTITTLYSLIKTLLPTLNLSNNAIRYYATLAHHYVSVRTRKLRQHLQYLYVLCFIYHRYQIIMDNLIMSFVLHIKRLMDDGSDYANQKEAEYRAGMLLDPPSLVKYLRGSSADTVAPDTPYKIFSEEAFKILPKEKQKELANFIEGLAFHKEGEKWAYYESQAKRITLYLRPIMLSVDFQYYQTNSTVLALIGVLRDFYAKRRPPSRLVSQIPTELLESLSKRDKILLGGTKNPDVIHPARFETYVYRKMFHLIENGRLFCNNSVSYCELEADLVDDSLVDKADEIAGELGYDKIAQYCDEHLDSMLDKLETAWQQTNTHIANGENSDITIKEDDKGIKTWSLDYEADETVSVGFF